MPTQSNGDRDTGEGGRQTQDKALDARLKQFGSRLDKLSKKAAPPTDSASRGSAMGMAFRLSTELVAGLVVGGLIGWFLDNWLGTSPIMLLLFFALGAAAGILNVIRTARQMQKEAVAKHGWGRDVPDEDEN